MKVIIVSFLISVCSIVNAQEFIQQQIYSPPVVQSNVIYPVSPAQNPIVVYQWVPYTVQENVVIEHYYMFRKTQTVVSRPVVRWVYQPVLIYR